MVSMVYSVLVLYGMCTFLPQFRLISSLLYLPCVGYTEETLCHLHGCDKLLFRLEKYTPKANPAKKNIVFSIDVICSLSLSLNINLL